MKDVLFGTETELGCQFKDSTQKSVEDFQKEIMLKGFGTRDFLLNGGRLYVDRGHLEYSTPETRSVRQLVAYERGIDLIISDISTTDGFGNFIFIRNNIDYCGNCFGYHQSFNFLGDISEGELGGLLAPFLTSRQIYSGSGALKITSNRTLINDSSPNTWFAISQRALHTTRVESYAPDTKEKPVLSFRNERLGNLGRRLHVVSGDVNRAEIATALNNGATALAVLLISNGWRPGYEIKNLPQAFRDLGTNQLHGWILETDKGLKSATEIQRDHWEAARTRFYANGDEETRWVLDTWDFVLGALEKSPPDLEVLVGKLDWPTKLLLYQDLVNRGFMQPGSSGMVKVDMAYHLLNNPLDIRLERLVSDNDIRRAAFHPPDDTRANGRSAAVNYIIELKPKLEAGIIDWNSINVWLKKGPLFLGDIYKRLPDLVLEMGNPRKTYCEEVHDLFSKIK